MMKTEILRPTQIQFLPEEEQLDYWESWNRRLKERKQKLVDRAFQTFKESNIDYRYSERNHLFSFWVDDRDRISFWASTGSWQVRRDRKWNGVTYKCKDAKDLLEKIDNYRRQFRYVVAPSSTATNPLPRRKVISRAS